MQSAFLFIPKIFNMDKVRVLHRLNSSVPNIFMDQALCTGVLLWISSRPEVFKSSSGRPMSSTVCNLPTLKHTHQASNRFAESAEV